MRSEPSKTLRCAIYTRKSSKEGLDQSFNSLDAQREACAAFILSQRHEGWTEIATKYDDGGYSGGNMNRPALQALVEDIDAGLVDSVVVYKVDRLTRSLADFAKIVDQFDEKKISFVSVTQQFNTTTSMGRLTLNVLLSFAQFEREVTGERIRDKIALSKRKGMWMGGRVPMGYNVVGRKLVVNESEAEIVRHLFRRYLELGCVKYLKEELEAQGVTRPTRLNRAGKQVGGAPYSRGGLYEVLRNRLYLGEIAHKDQSYPGEHEAIIDSDLWEAVQACRRLNTRGERTRRTAKAPSLLAGKIFLETGDRLTPSHTVKGHRRYRYYATDPSAPRKVRVPAAELEKAMQARVLAFLRAPRELIEGFGASEKSAAHQRKLAELGARAAADQTRPVAGWLDTIDRIVLHADRCSVFISRTRLGVQIGTAEPDPACESSIELKTNYLARRSAHGVRMVLQPDELGAPRGARVNSPLVKAAARARLWYEELVAGRGKTLTSLGASSGVNDRYASRILRCAFLSPELIERVLHGEVAIEQTLSKTLSQLPRCWSAQQKAIN